MGSNMGGLPARLLSLPAPLHAVVSIDVTYPELIRIRFLTEPGDEREKQVAAALMAVIYGFARQGRFARIQFQNRPLLSCDAIAAAATGRAEGKIERRAQDLRAQLQEQRDQLTRELEGFFRFGPEVQPPRVPPAIL
jgi:hypothetical protein